MSALIPAAAGPSAYWYLARGTGAVALLLLTGSVVLGVLGSVRFHAGPKWPRFTIDALHRDVSLLVIVFLVLHVLASVLDSFAPISLLDAVIPFGGTYRPFWLGLGAVSFDLLIALVVTSLLRRRMGYRSWRAVHWLAYASWPVAVFHGLGTGSDSKAWWMLALTGACVAAVLLAVFARIATTGPQTPDWLRPLAIAASAAVGVGLVVFAVEGPLQHGWARRSGTPASLLAPHTAPSVPVSTAGGSVGHAPGPFSATVSGTISQTAVSGGEVVDLALNFTGGERGILRVRLAGSPAGGGLSMTGSQVDLTAAGLRSAMAGQIVSLDGQQFDARVKDSSGSQLLLHANLNIDGQGGTVTGSLVARRA
ncbi:MAG: ferric reductase-like transmembrane domain-containing protein [Solirubrobacteraceae bacterium]